MLNQSKHSIFSREKIKKYAWVLLYRSWIFLGLAALGGAGGYFYAKSQVPIYSASVRVMVVRPAQEQSADLTRYMNNRDIASNYAQMATIPAVGEEVARRMNMPAGSSVAVFASVVPETQLISIGVIDRDPEFAAQATGVLVEVLGDEILKLQLDRYAEAEASLQKQIDTIQAQMLDTQKQIQTYYDNASEKEIAEYNRKILDNQRKIVDLQAQLNGFPVDTDPKTINETRAQILQLQTESRIYQDAYFQLVTNKKNLGIQSPEVIQLENNLLMYRQSHNNLLWNAENLRLLKVQTAPNIVELEKPTVPIYPIAPQTRSIVFTWALIGLGIGMVLVVLLEFAENTVKTVEDVKENLQATIVGQLLNVPEREKQGLWVETMPRAPVTEAFRMLRTNLEFASAGKTISSILITSTVAGEGKTTLAANLAGVLAQSGKKVLLVDADFHRPRVHEMLGLKNNYGLSDTFREQRTLTQVSQVYDGQNGVKFRVVTTGTIPPNPAELLGSQRMGRILEAGHKEADIIIIDGAPLIMTDALTLARHVNGLLFVVQVGKVRMDAAQESLERLQQTGTHILGVALNRIQERNRSNNYYAYTAKQPKGAQ